MYTVYPEKLSVISVRQPIAFGYYSNDNVNNNVLVKCLLK